MIHFDYYAKIITKKMPDELFENRGKGLASRTMTKDENGLDFRTVLGVTDMPKM